MLDYICFVNNWLDNLSSYLIVKLLDRIAKLQSSNSISLIDLRQTIQRNFCFVDNKKILGNCSKATNIAESGNHNVANTIAQTCMYRILCMYNRSQITRST